MHDFARFLIAIRKYGNFIVGNKDDRTLTFYAVFPPANLPWMLIFFDRHLIPPDNDAPLLFYDKGGSFSKQRICHRILTARSFPFTLVSRAFFFRSFRNLKPAPWNLSLHHSIG